ncbi:hypothetical protein M3Y94_00429700 [Aphelenchoides besseyi]|nr:hypothetical protein M3Y94_00429700 [Aphelenchoides besseyi]
MNSEAMGELELTRGCRVGKQLFGYINYYSWPYKSQIVSLNLDTLEWNENWIKLDGTVNEMVTDGEHTLIIRVQRKDGYHYYYRFVVNKPYSLSTCVWRNLQSIVHSRPDVYNFICSKLPTNFRPPRPIEHSVPFDTEVRDSCTVETGKQNCKTSDESVDSSLAFVSDFASYCETLGYKRGPGERVPSRSPIGTTHSRFPSRCPDSRK